MTNKYREMHETWKPACTVIATYDANPYGTKTGMDFTLLDTITKFRLVNKCAARANWAIFEAMKDKKKP